ncbi:MAG: hypothetical protein HN909_05820 [Phycisphaerales bacterium]|jgi:pimeloyl-ACP methyl ester carboxylesterase|nr:hypothetical protein [Phycisphaerales bacterium]MBT7171271.1 hypothetical protein [Phycisphaerales bacterium]
MQHRRYNLLWLVAISAATLLGGCDVQHDTYTQEIRRENGLVVILPGIEGTSGFNLDIRRGLDQAGCYRSIPIYNWGNPVPLVGMLFKQAGLGNRWSAQDIAGRIEDYVDEYPNRPVYIIGHSGGGALAVLIAEEMPEDKPVDGLILLSASISRGYDLTKALARCRRGIVNYYNTSDVGLLGVGTVLFGTADGGRGASAGLTSFDFGDDKLYQVELTREITGPFGGSAHAVATNPGFVSRYVAPWVLNSIWREDLISVPVTQHGPRPEPEPEPQEPLDDEGEFAADVDSDMLPDSEEAPDEAPADSAENDQAPAEAEDADEQSELDDKSDATAKRSAKESGTDWQ